MAKQKVSYRDKLIESHNALVTISKEIEDFDTIKNLATTPELKEKMNSISKRYDADFQYLSDKINYMIGKVAVEDIKIRSMILSSLLS